MPGARSRPLPECTTNCRSIEHADRATASITLDGTDEQVADYLEGLCANFCNLVDSAGRSVLHMAASCNRWRLIRWMLTTKKPQLSVKAIALRDKESGWTPLHRALFYGQLSAAKVLVEHGAGLSTLDWGCLSPLNLATKDRPLYVQCATAGLYEAYVWGINDNYNLGLGIHQSRDSPELLDFFRKEGVNIKQVLMCKFHTVFLSMSGKVYTCGHGQGGRLGHPSERAVIVPQLLKFVDGANLTSIVAIAASTDHSAFLAENGSVWTCGLNGHHQLGHCPPPKQLLTPHMLSKTFFKGHSIVGVCAGICHTVVHAEDAIFTFGLNAGQLGHPEKGDVLQSAPKMVSALNLVGVKFTHVVASDGATVCATQDGDVYTLHEYKCRKVASKQRDVVQIAVSGGRLDPKRYNALVKTATGTTSELRIAFLFTCGRIFLWSESSPGVTRCLIAQDRFLRVFHLALFNDDKAVFTTDEGEGFVGHFTKPTMETKSSGVAAHRGELKYQPSSRLKSSKSFSTFLDQDECFRVQVTRLANVFRGVRVACDYKGQNFCVVQANPKIGLVETPSVSTSKMLAELGQFLSDADTSDIIHDVVIKIDQNRFAAHRYVLASRSDYFRRKILERKFSNDEILVLDCSGNIRPAIFEQLLKFIYTDHCDMLKDGQHLDQTAATTCLTQRNQPDLVVSTLVDPHKISAFRVAQERKKSDSEAKSPRSLKSRQRETDPVTQLREAAQKFGVPDLIRKLNCIAYVDNAVVVVEPLPTRQLKFDRHKFPELYDVSIVSRNGREIHAHKCILIGRSEYFNSMLASGWLETSSSSSVNLPISADIIEFVVSYLYGDDNEHFKRADDAEFICNVLVVADLLLLTRLKELCEVVLCDLLTLKNVVDMVEFCSLYNADQLKLSCMNFIGLNLPALLESKAICVVSDGDMEDLTKRYHQLIPGMSRRVIASCSSFLDEIKFEDQASFVPLENMPTEDFALFVAAKEEAKGGGRASQKSQSGRRSTSSVSSITASPKRSSDRRQRTVSACSVEFSVNKKQGNTAPKVKGQSVDMPKRVENGVSTGSQTSVQATATAAASPSSAEIGCDSPPATLSKWLGGAEDMDHAFPDILNELRRPASGSSSSSLPPHLKVHRVKSSDKEEIPHATKLSQKQRKKLAREKSSPIPIPHSLMMEKYGRSATWGHDDQSAGMISLKDFMSTERMSAESTKSIDSLGRSPSSPLLDVRGGPCPKMTDVSTSSVNVWQKKRSEETPCFAAILKMEEERRTRLERMQTKQLHFIQMEDRAMNELLAYYMSHCDHDENIVVERILPDYVATPVWKHTKSGNTPSKIGF